MVCVESGSRDNREGEAALPCFGRMSEPASDVLLRQEELVLHVTSFDKPHPGNRSSCSWELVRRYFPFRHYCEIGHVCVEPTVKRRPNRGAWCCLLG